MTRLDTKYNAAKNWSSRLPVARDIWHEVKAECAEREQAEQLQNPQIADKSETNA